jgi:diguanylate cyclase (GGDEF)-like protein
VTISGLTLEHDGAESILEALTEASGIDSVGLIETVDDDTVIRHATGPLAEVLKGVPEHELRLLSALVDDVSSCYTGAQATGRSFLGTESIRLHARAVVVLPLWSGGVRTGTVVLAHSRPRGLTSRDVEPLELLAHHLAATLSASSLVTQLRRQAKEDRLTGLGNRAALEELLDLKRPDHAAPSVAVLLDLDHFKSVNDRLGHIVGDDALRAMAHHLTEHLDGVKAFRYGGDEFALFLNDMTAEHAYAVVRDLCETGQKILAPYGSSITAGLAADDDSRNLRDLFSRADKTLLWAKLHARGGATLLADSG